MVALVPVVLSPDPPIQPSGSSRTETLQIMTAQSECMLGGVSEGAMLLQMVKEAGGINVADEVQTGFGRTGSNYWGFQNQVHLPLPLQ